jgi:hypothetical protein
MRRYLKEKVAAPVYKSENTGVGIRHAYHVAPSIRKKSALTSLTKGGRSVGLVHLRTEATEFFFFFFFSVHPGVISLQLCTPQVAGV